MTTIGSTAPSPYSLVPSPRDLDRAVNVEKAGSTTPSSHRMDRATYAKKIAELSDGQFTAEEWLARAEESDRVKMQQAINDEKSLRGEGIYMGHSVGNKVFYDPKRYAQEVKHASQTRSEHYKISGHHYSIDALDVDSAMTAKEKLTGGDLKNLSYYADYLRNEVSAATEAKADFSFTGAWGKDRVTNDVNEYVGWLFQAAQAKSQVATDAQQTD